MSMGITSIIRLVAVWERRQGSCIVAQTRERRVIVLRHPSWIMRILFSVLDFLRVVYVEALGGK
jgi:hypothetical protein